MDTRDESQSDERAAKKEGPQLFFEEDGAVKDQSIEMFRGENLRKMAL
jgi:hypothetical protein